MQSSEIYLSEKKQKAPGGFLYSIFGRIWAFWALIVFVSTMIIFLIPFLLFIYFVPDPKKTNRFVKYSRVWMKVFLTLVGCPLTIKGREHFRKGETYIVICNHNSFIDVPVSSPGIPGGNKTIAKIEMSRIPVFNLLYKTGSVLVDRKNASSRRDSYTKMKQVLEMGLHMCIYPEGSRNRTEMPIKFFHDGAFRLAADTKKSIIPTLIFNTKKALPASKVFCLVPAPLSMHFLEPVDVKESENFTELRERVFKIMTDYYVANQR